MTKDSSGATKSAPLPRSARHWALIPLAIQILILLGWWFDEDMRFTIMMFLPIPFIALIWVNGWGEKRAVLGLDEFYVSNTSKYRGRKRVFISIGISAVLIGLAIFGAIRRHDEGAEERQARMVVERLARVTLASKDLLVKRIGELTADIEAFRQRVRTARADPDLSNEQEALLLVLLAEAADAEETSCRILWDTRCEPIIAVDHLFVRPEKRAEALADLELAVARLRKLP